MQTPNLDRFGWALSSESQSYDNESNVFESEPEIHCSCGCGQQIWLEDINSYVESEIWEDQYIINENKHILTYYKKNDQLLGSRSKSN